MMKGLVCSGDPGNKELDMDYALLVIKAFRNISGWNVLEGTRISNDLIEHSKRYSKQNRCPAEVAYIFKIAAGI